MCASQFCDVMNCFSRKKFSDQHNLDVVTRLVSETSKLDSRVPFYSCEVCVIGSVCHLYNYMYISTYTDSVYIQSVIPYVPIF